MLGHVHEADGSVSVEAMNHVMDIKVGDVVIGIVDKVNEKNAELVIVSVEGKTFLLWPINSVLNFA